MNKNQHNSNQTIIIPTAGDMVEIYDSCAQQNKIEKVARVENYGKWNDGSDNLGVVTLRETWAGVYEHTTSPKFIRKIVN